MLQSSKQLKKTTLLQLHIGGEWFQNEHEKPLAKAMSRFYKISRKFSENKKKDWQEH